MELVGSVQGLVAAPTLRP